MSRPLKLLFALTSLSVSSACFPKAGAAPGPLTAASLDEAPLKYPGMTAQELEEGRALFLQSCEGCHSYPDTAHYPEAKWPSIMAKMGPKSELTAEQAEKVLRFVVVTRE